VRALGSKIPALNMSGDTERMASKSPGEVSLNPKEVKIVDYLFQLPFDQTVATWVPAEQGGPGNLVVLRKPVGTAGEQVTFFEIHHRQLNATMFEGGDDEALDGSYDIPAPASRFEVLVTNIVGDTDMTGYIPDPESKQGLEMSVSYGRAVPVSLLRPRMVLSKKNNGWTVFSTRDILNREVFLVQISEIMKSSEEERVTLTISPIPSAPN
jgi:hypothetical protein